MELVKQIQKRDVYKLSCEKCGSTFEYVIHAENEYNDGNVIEKYSIICPVCGHLVHRPLDTCPCDIKKK